MSEVVFTVLRDTVDINDNLNLYRKLRLVPTVEIITPDYYNDEDKKCGYNSFPSSNFSWSLRKEDNLSLPENTLTVLDTR